MDIDAVGTPYTVTSYTWADYTHMMWANFAHKIGHIMPTKIMWAYFAHVLWAFFSRGQNLPTVGNFCPTSITRI